MKRSSLWVLPLLLAVVVVGAYYFDRQAAKGDRELDVYVRGGQRMAQGSEIYLRNQVNELGEWENKPFTYPPFAAVPFVPFVQLPEDWHPEAWFVVNFLILLAMIRWLHRYARSDATGAGPPRLWWFWIPTAVFGGRHVVSVFTNQSHDLMICGMVALTAASWCGHRRVSGLLAGLWAGLGAATKATPLIFLGLFGLRLHWLGIVAMLVATVGATLLPDLIMPRTDGRSWVVVWYEVNLQGLQVGGTAEAVGAWNAHSVLNQSWSGAVTRLFTPVEIPNDNFVVGDKGDVLLVELAGGMTRFVNLAGSALVLATIALGVWFARRAVRLAGGAAAAMQRTVGLGEVGAFACGMVLLSPQSSKSHFCIWLFPVAFVVNYLLRRRADPLAMLLFVAAFVAGMMSKGLLGRQLANLMLAYGSVAAATFLLLLATVRCLQVAARKPAGEAAAG